MNCHPPDTFCLLLLHRRGETAWAFPLCGSNDRDRSRKSKQPVAVVRLPVMLSRPSEGARPTQWHPPEAAQTYQHLPIQRLSPAVSGNRASKVALCRGESKTLTQHAARHLKTAETIAKRCLTAAHPSCKGSHPLQQLCRENGDTLSWQLLH